MRRLSNLSRKLNNALVARASFSGLLRSSGDLMFPCVVLITYAGNVWLSGRPLDAVSMGVLVMMTGLLSTHLSAVALGLEYRLAHSVALTRIESVMRRPVIDPEEGRRLTKRDGPRCLRVDQLPVGPEEQADLIRCRSW